MDFGLQEERDSWARLDGKREALIFLFVGQVGSRADDPPLNEIFEA